MGTALVCRMTPRSRTSRRTVSNHGVSFASPVWYRGTTQGGGETGCPGRCQACHEGLWQGPALTPCVRATHAGAPHAADRCTLVLPPEAQPWVGPTRQPPAAAAGNPGRPATRHPRPLHATPVAPVPQPGPNYPRAATAATGRAGTATATATAGPWVCAVSRGHGCLHGWIGPVHGAPAVQSRPQGLRAAQPLPPSAGRLRGRCFRHGPALGGAAGGARRCPVWVPAARGRDDRLVRPTRWAWVAGRPTHMPLPSQPTAALDHTR